MKFQTVLYISTICAITLFSACKNDSNAAKDTSADTAQAPNAVTDPASTAPGAPGAAVDVPAPDASTFKQEPAQNAAGVWHYTCPKGCAGGSGLGETCKKCGSQLAHNSSYHGTDNPIKTITAPAGQTAPATGQQPAPTTKPEPAQNAAGVWHYTCSNGCAGGAGAAAPCSKCGTVLAHNKAYHQ